MLMLSLWGLATLHCDLEQMPGFEFLAFCHSEDASSHQDEDCHSDGCSDVESGLYRIEEQAASAPVPLLVSSFLPPGWETTPPLARPQPVLLNGSPPDLPKAWQFSYRTALPPRAPPLAT